MAHIVAVRMPSSPLPLRRRGAKAGMDVFAIATRTAPLLRSGRGRRAAPGEGSAFRGDLTHPHPNPSPASQERVQGCAHPSATLCYPSPAGASGNPVTVAHNGRPTVWEYVGRDE